MKKYKIFNKTGLAICLTLGLVAGSACSPTDDGPSIDDHFLNYERGGLVNIIKADSIHSFVRMCVRCWDVIRWISIKPKLLT